MAQNVKLAFIGVGRIAQQHLKRLKAIGDNELVGVCDTAKDAAERTVAEFGGKAFTDSEEMLDKARPDALIICTPPFVRKGPIAASCARGLPFFCEKPPAFSLEEGHQILEIVQKAGVLHTVGFMYRHLAIVERARKLLENESVVAIRSTFVNAPLLKSDFPAWFKLQERSGGPIVDQALHVFDLLRYVSGEISEVFAYGSNRVTTRGPDVTIFDSFNVTLRFAGGVDATHNHSWASRANQVVVEFLLRDGSLLLDLSKKELHAKLRNEELHEKPGDDCYKTEMEHFLAAVRMRDGGGLRSPYSDALKSLAVCISVNDSAALRKAISVDTQGAVRAH